MMAPVLNILHRPKRLYGPPEKLAGRPSLSVSTPSILVMGDFAALLENLSADNHVRGIQFERVCKWYLENDPYYRDTVRKVWLWDDWEHKWGADAGIDLVVADHDGQLWAVQSKAYDEARAVTKRDVDKFLSESSRKWFQYRLLIATTNRLHPIAQRTIDDQEKKVGFVGLADLLTAEVSWPASPDVLRPIEPPKPAKPHSYQKKAVGEVVAGFQAADRGQLIMACGTGKTLTSLFIAEKLEASRTLVLLPSLSLLKQTMAVWRANSRTAFEALPVCSDETVSEDDTAIAHVSELCLPVKTDPAAIAEFLRRRSGPRVIFSTYQSSPQIAKAFALGQVPQFDLAIADESHRVAGDESTVFATILDSNAIKARRRLFMTATPRYYTGRVVSAARESEMEVASMDDPAKFGEVFHRLTFGEAIQRGLLTDYQVAIMGVDDATYRRWAEKGVLVKRADTTTDARSLASQIGLAKAMRKYHLRRVISFHSRVVRAKRFAADMPDVLEWMPEQQRPSGRLWTGYASGEMSAGERHVRLQRLRQLDDGERGLLTNARCLSEGVDVPTLDGVAFIDPRGSEVDIVQAVGRAIRSAEDKTIGTIVIPVFIDTDADPDTALNDSSFKAVWRIIRALRAHDEDLAEQIDAFRRQLGRSGGRSQIPAKIHLDVTQAVGTAFVDAFDVRLVEMTSARWEFWFGLLQRYAGENGTARVPVGHVMDGYALGRWASVQRSYYSNNTLTGSRREKLENLPGWTWDIAADQWSMWMGLMHQFVAEHGHANVPFPYVVGEHNLRSWVATQRGLHKRGAMAKERILELEALPGWLWDILEDNWSRHYEALKTFSAREGHARAPQRYVEGGLKLGQWVAVQRANRDDIPLARKTLLEALAGWTWDPFTDGWERVYDFLRASTDREGHARVPKDHREGGVRLGDWVIDQRVKRDNLDESQRERLEALPGWIWDARDHRWQMKLDLLQQFQRREGHASVPQRHLEDGVNLGSWVNEQRNKQDTMRPDRKALLESVPGWIWDPYTEAWERGYQALMAFASREGHCRVPGGHIEQGVTLGAWVKEQRSNRSQMADLRRVRLESVPGWSWNAVEDSWMEHLEMLRAYAERHGNTNVPVDHVEGGLRLGQWTRLRRREHKKLSSERQALLEALPGWFWGRKADHMWEQKYSVLRQFSDREGHARPPYDHVEGDVKLGQWVVTQRAERDKISPERRARLEGLPRWTWTVSQDVWDDRYELVQRFAIREGHSRVAQKHVEKGIALGSWVSTQRDKQNKLSPERRAKLEALPGWTWDPYEEQWQRSYELVRKFGDREGHTRVPDRHIEDGVNIGSWVLTQRTNRGKLSTEQKALLEALPGWVWDAYVDRWERGYKPLAKYTDECGTSQVPNVYVTDDGFPLGQWVNAVRSRYKNGSLRAEYVKQVEALAGWTWAPKADSWGRAYELLLEYVEKHGNARVPQSYGP